MIIKQVQFKGVDSQGNVLCQPILFNRDGSLEKTAAAVEMRSKLHPRVQDFVRGIIPTSAGIYILVNALGAGEYWGSNVNGDFFPEKSLIHAPSNWEQLPFEEMRRIGKAWDYGFPTFMNAYPYKHHMNKDPSRAFGRVELAVWNPKMHRVELVIYLDRALCMQFDAMDVIERIERGEFPDVSMGCKVPFDVCMICGKESKTPNDYCEHAAMMMNKILPDGRKVCVRNDFPRFFDISIVFIGADKTAKVMAKLAHVGKQVCLGDFCTVPRPSFEVGNAFSNFSGLSDLYGDVALEKVAAMRARARNAAIGGSIGAGAGIAGGVAAGTDRDEKKKDLIKDFVAGSLAGALIKNANDPIKKKVEVQGVPIWIEWKKGETRVYKDKKGVVKYERRMKADYGYIPDTLDSDGEELDVYLGPDKTSPRAFVIKQLKKDGSFDEHKVMIGYRTKEDAKASYDHHMGGAKERFGGMRQVPVSALKALFGENGGSEKKASLRVFNPDGSRNSAEERRHLDYLRSYQDYTKELSRKEPSKYPNYHARKAVDFDSLTPHEQRAESEWHSRLEKKASACSCSCDGEGLCDVSVEKIAALVFPVDEKTASHAKLSELIKSIPAGPFSKETLPRLENSERDIPNDVLDLMGGLPNGAGLSTPAMAGIVLKPREFQRVVLVHIGRKPLADDLDRQGMTFPRSNDVDSDFPISDEVEPRLLELLSALGITKDRSAAASALSRRSVPSSTGEADKPFKPLSGAGSDGTKVASGPLMTKLSMAYNSYRQWILKKTAHISNFMTTDPQLRADLFGSSMAQVFAGGIDKVATSVLSPDSLAYLVGAYQNRDIPMTPEVVASLAQTGAVAEAA